MKRQILFHSVIGGRVLLLLGIVTLLFWNLPVWVNVYSFAPLGVLFEVLWLPMVIALFVLPIFSLMGWMRRRYSVRSFYFYSVLLSLVSIVLFLYRTSKGF